VWFFDRKHDIGKSEESRRELGRSLLLSQSPQTSESRGQNFSAVASPNLVTRAAARGGSETTRIGGQDQRSRRCGEYARNQQEREQLEISTEAIKKAIKKAIKRVVRN
jgi:hypothetical protein